MPYEDSFLAWDYPGIGRNMCFLCIQAFLFFALTLAIDFQLLQKLAYLCKGKRSVQPSEPQQPPLGGVYANYPREMSLSVWLFAPLSLYRLGGLVVKASASRAEGPGFESRLRRDFSGSSRTSDSKTGTPVPSLPGAWRYRVSTGTGRPGVSIL